MKLESTSKMCWTSSLDEVSWAIYAQLRALHQIDFYSKLWLTFLDTESIAHFTENGFSIVCKLKLIFALRF